MSRDEVIARIRQNLGKLARITFTAEARNPLTDLTNTLIENKPNSKVLRRTQDMTIINVDDEGFVTQIGAEVFWSTFDDVENIDTLFSQG